MSASSAIDEILVNSSPGETRIALVAEGRLVELQLERASGGSLVGNIYLGRVAKLAPSIDAAFVELGLERAGFLAAGAASGALSAEGGPLRAAEPSRDAAISRLLAEGDALLVQIAKDAIGDKGPTLSARIALPGHFVVLRPGASGIAVSRRIERAEERKRLEAALAPLLAPGEAVTVRTAAQGAPEQVLAAELDALRARWRELLERARGARAPASILAEEEALARVLRDHAGPSLRRMFCDSRPVLRQAQAWLARHGLGETVACELVRGPTAVFARHEIEDQIAEALEPTVALPSGGRIAIGRLEALTAIDVDSARHAEAGRLAANSLAVNLEAAAEIARQARLRNLAGLILIDFIHMESAAHRARLSDALALAFAEDPVPTQRGGWTALGLYEMTRKRMRKPLAELLSRSCAVCHGAGLVKSAETVALELLRAAERASDAASGRAVTVWTNEAVIAVLEGPLKPARAELETRLGRPLALRAKPGYGPEQFELMTS